MHRWLYRTITLALFVFTVAACEGTDEAVVDAAPPTPDSGVDSPACFEDPMTHLEIINACTTATSIDKNPVTPLLNADGTLPPLP